MSLSSAIPNYEVKLFLKPKVVFVDNQIIPEVTDFFNITNRIKMSIQYLDTDHLSINEEGWIARVRRKESHEEGKFELTYKKRYPIVDNDIESALIKAKLDGFDSSKKKYEAQVDWGYDKQTLSFSRKKKVVEAGYSDMELLNRKHSLKHLIENSPKIFKDWTEEKWGIEQLKESRVYGPVNADRLIGLWEDHKLYIEVWKIINSSGTAYDYIVEVSFKADLYETANRLKKQLEKDLTTKGWFSPVDELKTQMALERY